jgi:hypothetical protein
VVRTVDEVVDRLRAIESGLPGRDRIAVFNRGYLQVSELVRDQMRDGFFRDPRFMERFDVVFAGLYFDSVDAAAAGADVARSWAPVVAARRRRGVGAGAVDNARDAAWVHAVTLWELRHVRPLTEAYRRTLAQIVGLVGRQMLVAYGLPTGSGNAVAASS